MTKTQRYEYQFIKNVIKKRLNKEYWNKRDMTYCYNQFKRFIRKMNLDEIDLLRKGEVFLGEYIPSINKDSIDAIYDTIDKIILKSTELQIPVLICILGTLFKLALSVLNNELKEELNDETML